MSQKEYVLNHLRSGNHLTPDQAFTVYGIRRLAARIHELIAEGFNIKSEPQKDILGRRYTRYSLR